LRFKEFGWNSFFLEIPEEMNFTRQGGDAKTGHLILETESCLIEAKWEPFEPKKVKPLSEVAEALVEERKKQSKKKNITVSGTGDAYVSKHKALCMNIRSDAEERVYIWYCDESQRIIILRFVFGISDEPARKIMKRALDTVQCHGKESIWSLLGLRFEIASAFILTDTKMTVGRTHFMLTDRKLSSFTDKTDKILIEYFSMANLIYEETYKQPDKWLQKNYLKDLRKKLKEGKLKLRPAKSITFKRHEMVIKQGTAKSGVSWRKTTIYTNATWYCSTTNRIYSITAASSIKRPIFFKKQISNEAHSKLLEDLLSTFKCH
jgi:hypothetical protein